MMNIPASVPAASSLGPHRSIPRRDVNNANSRKPNTDDFDADNIFEDIEMRPRNSITDSDLDRLLGPLSRHASSEQALEQESNRERGGPGNMIVVCPRCLPRGFGIMGPHWWVDYLYHDWWYPLAFQCPLFSNMGCDTLHLLMCTNSIIIHHHSNQIEFSILSAINKRFGPICCLGLLLMATIYFAPKAYADINPISSFICILFFTVGAISLAVVSCSDPGIVKREACIPSEVSAARGWRYCDLCRWVDKYDEYMKTSAS